MKSDAWYLGQRSTRGGDRAFTRTRPGGEVAPKAVARGERDPYVDQVFFAVGKFKADTSRGLVAPTQVAGARMPHRETSKALSSSWDGGHEDEQPISFNLRSTASIASCCSPES